MGFGPFGHGEGDQTVLEVLTGSVEHMFGRLCAARDGAFAALLLTSPNSMDGEILWELYQMVDGHWIGSGSIHESGSSKES